MKQETLHDRQLLEAIFIFAGNLAMCLMFFPAEVQGFGDAVRGWTQFNALLSDGEPIFGADNQISLRIVMAAASIVLLWALVMFNLIERRVLITYLALPVSAYLATKIRMEFVFFPLALISTKLGWKKEVIIIVALVALSLRLDERNGIVLIAYRLGVLVFRVFRPKTLIIFALVAIRKILEANQPRSHQEPFGCDKQRVRRKGGCGGQVEMKSWALISPLRLQFFSCQRYHSIRRG